MKNKVYLIVFTTICLIAGIICAICNFAIDNELTWSLIPISSLIFAWLILLPSMILNKDRIITTLASLTIFIIPFLYILSVLIKNKTIFSIGTIMSLTGAIYLWSIVVIFKKLKQKKIIATGISLLLAIPLCLIINITLSKMILEPVIDIWDILSISILLIIAIILFITDYYKNKKMKV